MSCKIIGVTGPAHCGKDTLADFIIAQRPKYVKASFADPIKEMVGEGLDLSSAQLYGDLKDVEDKRYGCTPRHMLQTLGTEWGRELISSNVWVIAMGKCLESLDLPYVIIPDVRFENEAKFVREHGTLIHITGRDLGVGAGHVSEKGVAFIEGDCPINNDDLVETFYDHIDEALSFVEA